MRGVCYPTPVKGIPKNPKSAENLSGPPTQLVRGLDISQVPSSPGTTPSIGSYMAVYHILY